EREPARWIVRVVANVGSHERRIITTVISDGITCARHGHGDRTTLDGDPQFANEVFLGHADVRGLGHALPNARQRRRVHQRQETRWHLSESPDGAVPDIARSREMTHAGHELWLHPLSIGESQFGYWAAFELFWGNAAGCANTSKLPAPS